MDRWGAAVVKQGTWRSRTSWLARLREARAHQLLDWLGARVRLDEDEGRLRRRLGRQTDRLSHLEHAGGHAGAGGREGAEAAHLVVRRAQSSTVGRGLRRAAEATASLQAAEAARRGA